MQHFSKQFAAELMGYHYQQITGDSGPGATLGSFEGRVTGLGPDITYTLMCGNPDQHRTQILPRVRRREPHRRQRGDVHCVAAAFGGFSLRDCIVPNVGYWRFVIWPANFHLT